MERNGEKLQQDKSTTGKHAFTWIAQDKHLDMYEEEKEEASFTHSTAPELRRMLFPFERDT